MGSPVRSALLLAGTAVLAVGCQAEIATNIDVAAPETATVAVTFDGEAADVMRGDPWRDELVGLVADRAGVPDDQVTIRETAESFRVQVEAPVGSVTGASGLTGVADISVTGTTATVTLTQPDELDAALEAGVEGEEDADALLAAMRGGTTVGVTVSGPGKPTVTFVAEDGQPDPVAEPLVDGSRAWFGQPLTRFSDGTLEVHFDDSGSGTHPGIWVVLAGAAGAFVWAARRRDQKLRALRDVGWA